MKTIVKNLILRFVLDRPKGLLTHLLRPKSIWSSNTTFGNFTCGTPLSREGVHGANKTGSNKPQRLFARSRNKLSGGYTSRDYVTTRAWCAITALQPSTSINRGLNAIPKVEHFFLSKPSYSDLYWLECRSAYRYTPPSVPRSILKHFTTTLTTAFKTPAVTFSLGMIKNNIV